MNTSASLTAQYFGQSIWLDSIQRSQLRSGALARMIAEQGLTGLTCNPSRFETAIIGSRDYDSALTTARPQADSEELFYNLAIDDIREATDLFADLYTRSGGHDGLVSLSVSPEYAYDTDATIEEAEMLFRRVDRPNLLICVPATQASLRAIETLVDRGININASLLFSISRYEAVVDAYLLGLESRLRRGQSLQGIRSVANFCVSRLDDLVDRLLQSIIAQGVPKPAGQARALLGRIAIANAKLAYQRFKGLFGSPRFQLLADAGAHSQRLLWSSTSTNNPAYSDLLYVESLIGQDTISSLSPATFTIFNQQGVVAATLERDVAGALHQLAELEALDIELAAVARQLEQHGVNALVESFHNLLQAIADKTRRLSATGA